MELDNSSPAGFSIDSTTHSDTSADPTSLLERALSTLRGHADFAQLVEVHQIAVEQFQFRRSLEEAAALLRSIPGVSVEESACVEEARVYAAEYWKRR